MLQVDPLRNGRSRAILAQNFLAKLRPGESRSWILAACVKKREVLRVLSREKKLFLTFAKKKT
jgi:hypothetical protein